MLHSPAPAPADDAPADNRMVVIMNAGSGDDDKSASARTIERRFASRKGFELRRVGKGARLHEAARAALRDGVPLVVAAGGDGTVTAIASVLADGSSRMGVLPLGTFNYFARSCGIPEPLDEALAVLETGVPTPIAVGTVNGHVFLNNASLGLYPSILREREAVYRRWGRGRLAAYWSVLRTLFDFRGPLTLTVTVDGTVRRFRTPLVFIANNAYQLELFDLQGADEIRNGTFAVFVAPDASRLKLIWHSLRLAFGGSRVREDFEFLAGREVVVEPRGRQHRSVALDGERVRLQGPFRFVRHENALEVVMPA